MTFPTVPIRGRAVGPTGVPVPRARITARLSTYDYQLLDGQTIVAPTVVTTTADDDAWFDLALWANLLGVTGSHYILVVEDEFGMFVFRAQLVVPDAPQNTWPLPLGSVLSRLPAPSIDNAQQALRQVQQAQVDIQAIAVQLAQAAATVSDQSGDVATYAQQVQDALTLCQQALADVEAAAAVVAGAAPLVEPAFTGPVTVDGQPVCDVPTAQGIAYAAALIF